MEQLERQHDGYIVPFDIIKWNLMKGDIIPVSDKKGRDFYEISSTLQHLPIEIVETWEKHYPEQTEIEPKPDYSKVIELIEGERPNPKHYELAVNANDYSTLHNIQIRNLVIDDILTKIIAL